MGVDAHRLARTSDPQTSHDAAASLDDVRASQRAVHALLRTYGPATDERLVHLAALTHLRMSPSGVRTRRHELVEAELVVDTGRREQLASGRYAILWEAVA